MYILVYSSAPRIVKFVKGLSKVVAEEGKEAVFECTISPSDASVKWSHRGAPIEASKKYVISHRDVHHSLTLTELTVQDSGEVTAEAEGEESQAHLRVEGEMGVHQGWKETSKCGISFLAALPLASTVVYFILYFILLFYFFILFYSVYFSLFFNL